MRNKAILTALFLIITGIVLGAFGAHGLRPKLEPHQLEGYKTAVDYQMYHGLAILVLGTLNQSWIKKPMLILMGIGLTLFSGSIYGLTIANVIQTKANWLGPITPIGGTILIVAWSMLLVSFIKHTKLGKA